MGPNGQTVVLMSNAGEDLGDTTLVFDDGATNFLPVASRIFSGTYKPTDYYTNGGFYPPAPSRPYGAALSVFNGTDPNGVWKLFVIDTEGGDIGRIAGGWAISMSGDDSAGALRFTWDSGHKLLLEFSAVSNKTYTLQYRDKIGTGSWSNLLDFTSASTNRTVSFTNAMPPGTTARYYRLVTPRQSAE